MKVIHFEAVATVVSKDDEKNGDAVGECGDKRITTMEIILKLSGNTQQRVMHLQVTYREREA